MKQCQMEKLKGIVDAQLAHQDLLASSSQLLEQKINMGFQWNFPGVGGGGGGAGGG